MAELRGTGLQARQSVIIRVQYDECLAKIGQHTAGVAREAGRKHSVLGDGQTGRPVL